MTRVSCLVVFMLLALLSGLAHAQQFTPEQREVANQKEFAALKAEIAELRKLQAPVIAAAQMKVTQSTLTATLLSLRDQVQPACKAVKGKLAFTFNGAGQVTAVTCAVK